MSLLRLGGLRYEIQGRRQNGQSLPRDCKEVVAAADNSPVDVTVLVLSTYGAAWSIGGTHPRLHGRMIKDWRGRDSERIEYSLWLRVWTEGRRWALGWVIKREEGSVVGREEEAVTDGDENPRILNLSSVEEQGETMHEEFSMILVCESSTGRHQDFD
ncbi:hypothetical protein RRG08_011882 [Elysia crispata]|uniref:Uncharacterized protein n=1 Tax=Elysia crispata TaxID=231223 RepID=A0AAE0ZM55_9GAST|nr:hypothetical protein RRG08_011882 [Elysia crispata]